MATTTPRVITISYAIHPYDLILQDELTLMHGLVVTAFSNYWDITIPTELPKDCTLIGYVEIEEDGLLIGSGGTLTIDGDIDIGEYINFSNYKPTVGFGGEFATVAVMGYLKCGREGCATVLPRSLTVQGDALLSQSGDTLCLPEQYLRVEGELHLAVDGNVTELPMELIVDSDMIVKASIPVDLNDRYMSIGGSLNISTTKSAIWHGVPKKMVIQGDLNITVGCIDEIPQHTSLVEWFTPPNTTVMGAVNVEYRE